MFSDSSQHTISAVLLQSGSENPPKDNVVSYASCHLLDRETRYATIEKELLSVVYGLQKFRQWIYGTPGQVFSDHKPLTFLNSLVRHNSRFAKWVIILQEFNIQTTYVPGKHQLADHLTRIPTTVNAKWNFKERLHSRWCWCNRNVDGHCNYVAIF